MQKNLNKNLGELLELFLAYIQVELGSSANTIAAYSSDLRIFFAHLEKNGVLYAEELKREHLLDFLEKRASAGISAKSMHRVMCSIRRYFRFLRKEQIIPNNPIADIELPRVEMRLPKTVAIKEIDSLLSKPNIERERGLRDAAIIAMLYGAGLRVSELSGLKLADLDLARGYLKILGKGQKERVVPLNEKALTIVEAYLLYGRPLLLNDQASMLVFIRKGGKHLSRVSIWKIIKKYAQLAGLSDLSPHKLRHSFATHLLEGGINLRALQLLMGHEELATTEIYMSVDKKRLMLLYEKCHPRAGIHSTE